MKNFVKILFVILFVGGCVALWGADKSPDKTPLITQITIPAPPQSLRWTEAKWTANDHSLQESKKKLDTQIMSGGDAKVVVSKYRDLALLNIATASDRFGSGYASHTNAVAIYSWAYAAQQDYVYHHTGFFDEQAYNALCAVDPNNSYEYTRLRFILTQEVNPNRGYLELEPLGKRLLRRNPSDAAVRKNLVYALADSSQPEKALPYALAWTKQSPNNADAHFVLAYCYQNLLVQTLKGNYADEAGAEYRRYLSLEPANASDRQFIQNLIDKVLPDIKEQSRHLKFINGVLVKID